LTEEMDSKLKSTGKLYLHESEIGETGLQ